jgi:hypothetical protein
MYHQMPLASARTAGRRGASLRERLLTETAKENGGEHAVHVATPDLRWDTSARGSDREPNGTLLREPAAFKCEKS